MSEQDNSIRMDENEGSGLLRSVEPTGGNSYSMSASDTVDGGTDAGSDSDGSDTNKDIAGSGDADNSDEEESDADGTDS